MKWLYCTGIILIYIIMVNGGQQGCFVDDFYIKEHWSGDEVIFWAYVQENDVVNIEISYEGLEVTEFFTTFYFTPSKNLSKRIEVKNGELHHFNLSTMKVANDWIEFKISSQMGTIELTYEPNIDEQIPINQTSHTFKDLIIKANNLAFCKEERTWEVFEGNYKTIPLGSDTENKIFHLKFYSSINIKPVLRMSNHRETLFSNEYNLMIEKTMVSLQPLENQQKVIQFDVSQNVTTMDIISEGGHFIVSVSFKTKPPPSSPHSTTPRPVANDEDCPACKDSLYISTLTPPLVIFIIASILVGLGFKFNTFLSRIKLPLKSKESSQQTNGHIELQEHDSLTGPNSINDV